MTETRLAGEEARNDALLRWIYVQQKAPDWYKEYFASHGNPFIPWPGVPTAIDTFLEQYDKAFGSPLPEELHSVMSAKMLEGLVDDLNAHVENDRVRHEEAIQNSKKYIEQIKKQVAQNGGNPDAVIDPTDDPTFRQKIEEYTQEPIVLALGADVPAGQKLEYFAKSATPQTIPEIEALNQKLGKSAVLLAGLSGPVVTTTGSFGDVAVTSGQKFAAGVLNTATVFSPAARNRSINLVLVDAFQDAVDKAGGEVVRQPWFERFQRDSHQIMAQGSSAAGTKTIIDDVITSIFRGAPGETVGAFRELHRINAAQALSASGADRRRVTGAKPGAPSSKLDINKLRMAKTMAMLQGLPSKTVVAYVELYRTNVARGLPPPNLNYFLMTNSGGSSLIRMGVSAGINKAGKAALGKFATSLGIKLAIPGGGWLAAALQIGGAVLGKIGGWFKGLTGIKEGLLPGDKEMIVVVCGAIFLMVFALPMFSQLNIDSSLATRFAGGGSAAGPPASATGTPTGAPLGPISYTGPQPSGPLQCLNLNVSPEQFDDVSATPFSSGQGQVINGAINAYPQFGLYNCILGCPQNHVNFYSGGSSSWWGWAPSQGNIVIYDGFFSGGAHAQARLIAHELAHQWYYTNPSVLDEFAQEGYCGKLCTYPSGIHGACSDLETVGETFAESAAMFLTGENLQSLCPRGYNFMDRAFRSCGGGQ